MKTKETKNEIKSLQKDVQKLLNKIKEMNRLNLSDLTKKYIDDVENHEETRMQLMCKFPEYFDSKKFNWENNSYVVAKYCPEHFDADKFNWENYSYVVAEHCPQHFDKNKYNWKKDSWAVAVFCPQFLHLKPKK